MLIANRLQIVVRFVRFMGYKKVFPNKLRRDRENLHASGYEKVGHGIDKDVERTLVDRFSTVQMTAVVTAMETGVPMTLRQIWEKAQETHRVGDRTVRHHLQRLIEDGRVVRLEAPSFSPLYVIAGMPPRHWFRCRECTQISVTNIPLPEEVDIGMVDGAYMWGTCKKCIDSGVEVVVSALGNPLASKYSGGTPGSARSMDHVRPAGDPGSEAMTHNWGGPRFKKDKDPDQ